MGTIIVILVLAIIVVCAILSIRKRIKYGSACCGTHDAAPKKIKVKDKNKAHYPYTYTLTVDGMHCSNCARRVENALNALDGVWAKVSLGENTALLRCKASPDETAIRSAVSKAGYVVMNFKLG